MRYRGPEKSITEPEILAWGLKNGFDLSVVDTAAVYNPYAGRYLRRQASESLPDLIGNHGPLSVWIELKAPKKRRSILQTPHQLNFLKRKIEQGCFACVTDSALHLNELWHKYKTASEDQKKSILLADLPQYKVAS